MARVVRPWEWSKAILATVSTATAHGTIGRMLRPNWAQEPVAATARVRDYQNRVRRGRVFREIISLSSLSRRVTD